MKTFVIYEIWTRSKVVKAVDRDAALEENEPQPVEGLNLSNWHVDEVPSVERSTDRCGATLTIGGHSRRCELLADHMFRGELHMVARGINGQQTTW